MRVPPDVPPHLPPRAEAPIPLSDVVSADASEWDSACEALDGATAAGADDTDAMHDQEQEHPPGRRRRRWPDPDGEQELDTSRRPDLGNGFWVLPDLRPYLPRSAMPGRSPLVAQTAPLFAADLPDRRQARRGPHEGDENDGNADDPGHGAA